MFSTMSPPGACCHGTPVTSLRFSTDHHSPDDLLLTIFVRITPFYVPTMVSPESGLYRKRRPSSQLTSSFACFPAGWCLRECKSSPNSSPYSRDCLPRRRSYGVFPSCPTSYLRTRTAANSTVQLNTGWSAVMLLQTQVSRASFSTLICPSTVRLPLSNRERGSRSCRCSGSLQRVISPERTSLVIASCRPH